MLWHGVFGKEFRQHFPLGGRGRAWPSAKPAAPLLHNVRPASFFRKESGVLSGVTAMVMHACMRAQQNRQKKIDCDALINRKKRLT
jgi:hypothetical protein